MVSIGVEPGIEHGKGDGASSASSTSDPLDLRQDEGWEDVQPEDTNEQLHCIFGPGVFPDMPSLLAHTKTQHDCDLPKLIKDLSVFCDY